MAKKNTSIAFSSEEELINLKHDAIDAGMDVSSYLKKLAKDARDKPTLELKIKEIVYENIKDYEYEFELKMRDIVREELEIEKREIKDFVAVEEKDYDKVQKRMIKMIKNEEPVKEKPLKVKEFTPHKFKIKHKGDK